MSQLSNNGIFKSRKRSTDLPQLWLSRFGIFVTSRDPQTKAVTAATCRFCLSFGREKGRVTTAKIFCPPFRTDNFQQHLRLTHPKKWDEFERRESAAARDAFFDVEVPYAETIESHYGASDPGLFVKVEQPVLDLITRYFIDQAAGQSLPPTVSPSDSGAHLVSIRHERIFKIVIDQVSYGLSFREVTLTLRNLRSSCGLGFLNALTEQKVSQYVKTLCVLSLHALTAIRSSDEVWSYSLAIDSATHNGTSYLDVRARFIYRGSLRNYHLLAIPFSESHTGQNMFEHVRDLMTVVGGIFWDHKLLAVTTDGAANMTGCHRGMVTLLQNACPSGIYRIWCGAHQLDLIVRDCVSRQLYDCFYQTLTSLVSYLRRQQRLILQLGYQCPRVCTTRWLSLGNVVTWILRNRSPITTYISRDDTANFEGLSPCWWPLCFVVEGLMEPVNICFQAVQGKDTIIAEQNARSEKLASDVKQTFNVKSTSDMTGVDVLSAAALGSLLFSGHGFYCTRDGLREFFDGCGSFARECMAVLPENELSVLLGICARLTVEFVGNLEALRVERDLSNAAVDVLPPPVTPGELAKTSMAKLLSILEMQRPRLDVTWKSQEFDNIEEDFRHLLRAVRRGEVPL